MTPADFAGKLRQIEREMKVDAEEAVRREWREGQGLIYVRTYTVPAYFRPVKPSKKMGGSK